jgi:hypothetical protein
MVAVGVERHHAIGLVKGRQHHFPSAFVDLDAHDRADPRGLASEHEHDESTFHPPRKESFGPSDYPVAH